jgi:hypothetical protein
MRKKDSKKWVEDLLKKVETEQDNENEVFAFISQLFVRICKESQNFNSLTDPDRIILREAISMYATNNKVTVPLLLKPKYELLRKAIELLVLLFDKAHNKIIESKYLQEGENGLKLFQTLLYFTENPKEVIESDGFYFYIFVDHILLAFKEEAI